VLIICTYTNTIKGHFAINGILFVPIWPQMTNNERYGNKAHQRSDVKKIIDAQNLTVLASVKNKKARRI
jgi:hypothetical protein